MAEPTSKVRAGTYERDGYACVSCGRMDGLQYQHRPAVGFGGSKRRPTWAEGLTSCWYCNPEYERSLRPVAVALGWKISKYEDRPERIPYFAVTTARWYLLGKDGPWRAPLAPARAAEMMRDVYGNSWEGVPHGVLPRG